MDLRKKVAENSSDLKQITCGEPGMKDAEEGSVLFKNDGN